MTRAEVPTYTATIYVAGNVWEAETICRDYCDEVGFCVNVSETNYLYTGGEEAGVAVGLINYARFPATPDAIFAHAEALALRLLDGLHQDSFSIVATDKTVFVSRRDPE